MLKKYSDLAGRVGHSIGWITSLKGLTFYVKLVSDDKSFFLKITILSELGKSNTQLIVN